MNFLAVLGFGVVVVSGLVEGGGAEGHVLGFGGEAVEVVSEGVLGAFLLLVVKGSLILKYLLLIILHIIARLL